MANETALEPTDQRGRAKRVLTASRGVLSRRALRFVGFVVLAYLVLKLVPGLEKALENLQSVKPRWVIGALAVETLSEIGYVISWRGILDPDDLLVKSGHGKHLGARVAWAQLGGGMVVPGGTLGSMGVGAWMLHRLRIPMDSIAQRQFTLMFLNSSVDGLALIFFGIGLSIGVFDGSDNLALTLIPALITAFGIALALFVATRADRLSKRLKDRRPKLATVIGTLSEAVTNTKELLSRRGSGKIVLGAVIYLGFDMAVLWGALSAVGVHPDPSFAIVAMAYLVGGLAGSIPLPASLGAIMGMGGMLVLFGVDHNQAIAAVVLYQAIGFIVPLAGGGISYLMLRREIGAIQKEPDEPTAASA